MQSVTGFSLFHNQVTDTLNKSPECFWTCEPAFKDLLKTSSITDMLNLEILALQKNHRYIPEGVNLENNIVITSNDKYSLSLRVFKQGDPQTLFTYDKHRMIGIVNIKGAETISFQKFKASSISLDSEIHDIKHKLKGPSLLACGTGDIVRVNALSDILLLSSLSMDQLVVALIFDSDSVASSRWQYNEETLLPERCISCDENSSRLEYTAMLLARIGDHSSLPSLVRLTKHHQHYVRWGAIRALVAIDPQVGREYLIGALNDDHPHVRSATKDALVLLGWQLHPSLECS
jgi:hypothetical protein